MDKILDEIYLNPSNVGSLGGKNRLLREAKKHGITKQQVEEYLQTKDGYTQHKWRIRKFPRRKVISVDINDQHQMDLADMQKFADHNDGYRYILFIIDCFSRYAWAKPIVNKTPERIVEALETVYKECGPPLRCQTDKGKEFVARKVKQFFKDSGVSFFTVRNDDVKCAMAERLIRTIKSRLWLYMTEMNGYRYIDILPQVMQSYNNSVHSSIGYAPALVDNDAAFEIRRKMIEESRDAKQPKFQVGDHVRLVKMKLTFEKGYETNFTDELYKIVQVQQHGEYYQYKVTDMADVPVDGLFYEDELSKVVVVERPFHNIQRVLRQRKYKGRTQYLIRWSGYGPAYDSWEYKDDVE